MERKTHQVTASDRNEGLDNVKGPSYTSLLHQEWWRCTHTRPCLRGEHVCACRLRTMDGWCTVHFSLFSIAAYNFSRSYHSPFQNNSMPADCAGPLSFEVCFWKGCYYSQMGCVLLQTRQTLSWAPVSVLPFNEWLKQQGGEREISCIAWNPKCGFTPSNTHSFILSFFLVLFHFSFPFSPVRYVFIWFTNELSAVTAVLIVWMGTVTRLVELHFVGF